MSSKPSVSVPAGEPPAELEIVDLVVGTGDEAVKGKNVDVHYVGVAWSNGKQFDASWDRRESFEFRLGAGQVIQGWDQGVGSVSPRLRVQTAASTRRSVASAMKRTAPSPHRPWAPPG